MAKASSHGKQISTTTFHLSSSIGRSDWSSAPFWAPVYMLIAALVGALRAAAEHTRAPEDR